MYTNTYSGNALEGKLRVSAKTVRRLGVHLPGPTRLAGGGGGQGGREGEEGQEVEGRKPGGEGDTAKEPSQGI